MCWLNMGSQHWGQGLGRGSRAASQFLPCCSEMSQSLAGSRDA